MKKLLTWIKGLRKPKPKADEPKRRVASAHDFALREVRKGIKQNEKAPTKAPQSQATKAREVAVPKKDRQAEALSKKERKNAKRKASRTASESTPRS
ncbi:hypothetical protein BH10PSE6_BH10PSE6_24100 [soil metagenome]